MNSNKSNVQLTPADLLFVRQWNNMQYITGATFLFTVYSDYLTTNNQELHYPQGSLSPQEILAFAKSQVDYILGSNPLSLSYLVGFGLKFPKRVHHRAASSVSYKVDKAFVGCAQGYEKWFGRQRSNHNVLFGALVGGPNVKDEVKDMRWNYMQIEACKYNTAPLVGVFTKLNQLEGLLIKGLNPQTSAYK